MYEWQKRKLWMWIDLIMSQSIYQDRTSVRVTYSFPALNAFMLSITWHLGCLCLFLFPPSRFSLNVESAAPSLNYVQPSYPNYNANVNFKKTSAPVKTFNLLTLCVYLRLQMSLNVIYNPLSSYIFVCLYENSSSRPWFVCFKCQRCRSWWWFVSHSSLTVPQKWVPRSYRLWLPVLVSAVASKTYPIICFYEAHTVSLSGSVLKHQVLRGVYVYVWGGGSALML